MAHENKIVDGFKFMPRSLGAWIGKNIPESEFTGNIPWTPARKTVNEMTFALLTSAGISMKADTAFDMEREKKEPLWGDPTYRRIPREAREEDIEVNHLHVNTRFIKKDINVILPIHRFAELEQEGIVGRLAPTHYSIYGFQLDPKSLLEETMPRIAGDMKNEGVEAVLLTPT